MFSEALRRYYFSISCFLPASALKELIWLTEGFETVNISLLLKNVCQRHVALTLAFMVYVSFLKKMDNTGCNRDRSRNALTALVVPQFPRQAIDTNNRVVQQNST